MPVDTVWDGIRAGLADAHHDLDVRCRIDPRRRQARRAAARAAELVEFAGAQDRDLLIGVGGDSTERGVDHRAFAPVFARAGSWGCTAPSTPVRTAPPTTSRPRSTIWASNGSTTASGCSTIPELTRRVADARIPLTVCPISNVVIANVIDDVAQHPFARNVRPACWSRSTPTIPA